jgi:hypothetical protein
MARENLGFGEAEAAGKNGSKAKKKMLLKQKASFNGNWLLYFCLSFD